MKMSSGLFAYRRHVKNCPYFGPGGRDISTNKCTCTFHVDGKYEGRRPRFSLKTGSRTAADRAVAELTRKIDEEILTQRAGSNGKTAQRIPDVAEAVRLFLGSYGNIDKTGKTKGDLKYSSWRKYRNSLERLRDFCGSKRIHSLIEIDATDIEQFRNTRGISGRTWKTELQ